MIKIRERGIIYINLSFWYGERRSYEKWKWYRKRRKLWAVRVTTGYTLEGKQVRKYIGTYETKREAQESLFEYLKNPKLYKKITFKEITDLWFESYKKKEELRKVMELFN